MAIPPMSCDVGADVTRVDTASALTSHDTRADAARCHGRCGTTSRQMSHNIGADIALTLGRLPAFLKQNCLERRPDKSTLSARHGATSATSPEPGAVIDGPFSPFSRRRNADVADVAGVGDSATRHRRRCRADDVAPTPAGVADVVSSADHGWCGVMAEKS
jgi:hypothetical protein